MRIAGACMQIYTYYIQVSAYGASNVTFVSIEQ